MRVCRGAWNSFVVYGAKNLSTRQFLSSQVRSRGVQPVRVDAGADGFQMWKCITSDDMTSLVLTNRNAYIRCKGEELCSNPGNWQWRTCVSVGLYFLEDWHVACTSHIRGLLFQLHRSLDEFGDFGKFVIINYLVIKLRKVRNWALSLLELSNSLLRA
jgi:hypothetical protein